jgi:hypothetical protein
MIETLELLEEALVPAVSEASERPACLAPWRENPYRLMSLWDMLRFRADAFCRCSTLLGQMISKIQDHVMPTDDSWGLMGGNLGELERYCDELGLTVTASQIRRMKELLADERSRSRSLPYLGTAPDRGPDALN